jgi:hypothetical protein
VYIGGGWERFPTAIKNGRYPFSPNLVLMEYLPLIRLT